MKIIAFKRAKSHSSLHSEFITEYIDADLLPSLDGYETMIEEHFQLELAKNPERHEQHLKYLAEQAMLAQKADEDVKIVEKLKDKELEREFARFKAWQRHSGKTK